MRRALKDFKGNRGDKSVWTKKHKFSIIEITIIYWIFEKEKVKQSVSRCFTPFMFDGYEENNEPSVKNENLKMSLIHFWSTYYFYKFMA